MWNSIYLTVKEELGDVSDVAGFTRVTLRLLIAGILGAALGYEREAAGKSAGLRTHMLVAIGSAVFLMTPQLAGTKQEDLSRVIQGLVAGVGFLGAGAIIRNTRHKDEATDRSAEKGSGNDLAVASSSDEVKGMTTAAGIWMTAAIGMAVGMGRELTAVVSTVLALVVLAVVPKIVGRVGRRREDRSMD